MNVAASSPAWLTRSYVVAFGFSKGSSWMVGESGRDVRRGQGIRGCALRGEACALLRTWEGLWTKYHCS